MGVGVLSGTGDSVGDGMIVGVSVGDCVSVGTRVEVVVGVGVSIGEKEVGETGTTVDDCVAGSVSFGSGGVKVMTNRSPG